MKYIILLLLASLLYPLNCYSAPSQPTVSGVVEHNGSVTLSGSGFGIKSPVAPLFWDNVSDNYTGIVDGGVVPVGVGEMWAEVIQSAYTDVHFSTTNTRGKTTAYYSNRWSTHVNKLGALGGNNYPESTKLYVSWWMWLDKTACQGSANKWTRMTQDATWPTDVQAFIWEPNSIIVYGGDPIDTWITYSPQTCGVINEWQRMEQLIDNSLTPKPGVYITLNNVPFNSGNPYHADFALLEDITGIRALGADFNGVDAVDQANVDWGEIYVDNTLARVEICDNATKANATHCEPQIPQNTWNDGEIEILVNQGSFADGSTAYLTVSDSDGVWSTGTEITFGTSMGSFDSGSLPHLQ